MKKNNRFPRSPKLKTSISRNTTKGILKQKKERRKENKILILDTEKRLFFLHAQFNLKYIRTYEKLFTSTHLVLDSFKEICCKFLNQAR